MNIWTDVEHSKLNGEEEEGKNEVLDNNKNSQQNKEIATKTTQLVYHIE